MSKILPIVEGDGEIRAVPTLIRRILTAHEIYDIEVLHPHKRGELPKVEVNFDRFFQAAALEEAPILWVTDFDCSDCNDQGSRATQLKNRAAAIDPRIAVEFVFMVKEYETIFLADFETTGTVLGFSKTATPPANPESIRDAKGYISSSLPSGMAYKPTVHQEKLSARMRLDVLRVNSASYARFETAVLQLARIT